MPTKCFFFRAGSNDLDYSPGADYDMDLGENIAREDVREGEEDMDRMDVQDDPGVDYQEVHSNV